MCCHCCEERWGVERHAVLLRVCVRPTFRLTLKSRAGCGFARITGRFCVTQRKLLSKLTLMYSVCCGRPNDSSDEGFFYNESRFASSRLVSIYILFVNLSTIDECVTRLQLPVFFFS